MKEKIHADSERAQRLIAMGEMAATLAHEIRNPLGSMELFCSLLKKDLKGNEQSYHYAEQIFQGIKNLERIINNSLQFSRDVIVKKKICTDIQDFINKTTAFCKDKTEALGVEVLTEVSGLEYLVSFDPYLLNQALINIIQNAIEAASEGKTKVVKIFWENFADQSFKITVSDTGLGIEDKDIEKIFDPFYTTKIGGTGLGLPVSHSIIKSHGGSLDFATEVGLGTKVIITFPTNYMQNNIQSREDVCHAG